MPNGACWRQPIWPALEAYLRAETEYGWYLCLDGDRIVGGLGVIENDFHDRKDLTPNICAVYTEPAYRRRGVAGSLLNQAVADLKARGITPVYLFTDHTGFYERYGWEFFCMAQGDGEEKPSRMYIHKKKSQIKNTARRCLSAGGGLFWVIDYFSSERR